MTLEEAIRTAIEYEIKVRDVYAGAADRVKDDSGRKVMRQMAAEEQDHITYLAERLKEWKDTGIVREREIPRSVPGPEVIARQVQILKDRIGREMPDVSDKESDISMLKRALDVEKETSGFYARMVRELPPAQRSLFERFLEIERGHVAIVEAEIDYLNGAGYWFGLPEFNLEVE